MSADSKWFLTLGVLHDANPALFITAVWLKYTWNYFIQQFMQVLVCFAPTGA